jgi:hypothetical protein
MLAAAGMDAHALDRASTAAIELAEMRAWSDMYAAAPARWVASAGVGTAELGGALVLRWAATGRRYFSRAIGLGLTRPATPAAIEEILSFWDEHGIDMFLMQSLPGCAPGQYEQWLRERGMRPFDVQDRIVRAGQPASARADGAHSGGLVVERVRADSAEEWSDFLERVYRLDTGPWLPQLIGRPGWHQYVARRDGAIVAARGMYIGPDGLAWLGMDGPVPGIMTDDYEPDAAICEVIVADGLARGARGFLADIEAPSQELDTPAYEHFARLGFRRPYVRTHWTG